MNLFSFLEAICRQYTISTSLTSLSDLWICVFKYPSNISFWMSDRHLMLSKSKIELLIPIPPPNGFSHSPPPSPVNDNSDLLVFQGHKNPLFLVMLNGAFMFAAELLKNIEIDCETSFVKYSTYDGTQSTCEAKELIGLNSSLKGRNIVIVEDIIDSGFTMSCLIQKLQSMEVASIKIATMLFKPEAFKFDYKIDYIGMNIGNEFIVGYGLDYNEHGRNYPLIYQVVE